MSDQAAATGTSNQNTTTDKMQHDPRVFEFVTTFVIEYFVYLSNFSLFRFSTEASQEYLLVKQRPFKPLKMRPSQRSAEGIQFSYTTGNFFPLSDALNKDCSKLADGKDEVLGDIKTGLMVQLAVGRLTVPGDKLMFIGAAVGRTFSEMQ